jgi:prepilin-type processing-associated H-X9-DG protein
LLISILLPSLQKARRAANTIACASNLRSILQAMHVYAAQNNGSIPGSVWTTSQFMYGNVQMASPEKYNDATLPSVISYWDWACPTLKIMGVKFDERPGNTARRARWDFVRQYKAFRCPENTFIAGPFKTPLFTADIMMSYNTAIVFLVQKTGYPGVSGPNAPSEIVLPASYNVKLSKVGQGATKIYIADGSRYSSLDAAGDLEGPDSDFTAYGDFGGAFGDQGAWTSYSRSWCRAAASGNRSGAKADPRIFAYRHGIRAQFKSNDNYKANFGFFDGHVDLLGDFESSNPAFWLPKGTMIPNPNTQMWKDTAARFAPNPNYAAP